MKDISCVLVMSRHETDPQGCDDLTLEIDCTPTASVLQTDSYTTSFVNSPTVSFMDWAECLIEMTVSAGDCDSTPSSGNSHAHGTKQAELLHGSNPAVNTSASFQDNSLHNDQQLIHFDLTAINSNIISLQGDLTADEGSCMATNNNADRQCVDVLDPSHLTSAADKILAGQQRSRASSCTPTPLVSDLLKNAYPDIWTREDPAVRPHPVLSDICNQSRYDPNYLTDSCSEPLTFVTSVSRGFESGTASTLPISSTQTTTNLYSETTASLQTPILEASPDFTDTNIYSITCSSVSNVSDNFPSLCSPTESQLTDADYYQLLNNPSFDAKSPGHHWNAYTTTAGELTMHEIDIAAVEVVSSDLCEDPKFSVIPGQFELSPDTNPYIELFYPENTAPDSVSDGNNLVDITVYTDETPEASTLHPPQQHTLEHCTNISATPPIRSLIIPPTSSSQEFPPHSIVTYLADDVSYSQELVVDASPSSSMLHSQSHLLNSTVQTENKRCRKRCIHATTEAAQNQLNEFTTNPDLRIKTVSKCRFEHNQSNLPSWTHPRPGPSSETTDLSLAGDIDSLNDNTFNDYSNTTYLSTSTSSSVSQNHSQTSSNLSQTSSYHPVLHYSSLEMTFDALLTPSNLYNALLTPSDLYNPLLGFDSSLLPEPAQNNPHRHRTVSDVCEVSAEGSDASTTLPTTSASCTDGEASQEPLTMDKVKDTLRSKLKSRQENVSVPSHTWSVLAGTCRHLLAPIPGRSSPPRLDTPFTSVTWSSGQGAGLNSRQSWSSRQSSASCISQDESTGDNETTNDVDDEEEDVQMPPAHKRRKDVKKDDEDETVEESEESRLAKREKNRLAAQKCRVRRRDKIDRLTQQVQKLEEKQERIKTDVDNLEIEREQLEEMLRLHSFVCKKKL